MRRFALKFWAFLDKNKLMKTRIAHIILLLSFALLVGPVYGSTNGVPSDSQISSISAELSVVSDPIIYKVTIDNGSISKEYFVEAGEEIKFSAINADECLRFVRWSDGDTNETRTLVVDENTPQAIRPIFERKVFTISVSVDSKCAGMGTVAVEKLRNKE